MWLPGQDYEMWGRLESRIVEEEPESEPDPYVRIVVEILNRAIKDLDDCELTEVHEQRDAYWWLFVDQRSADEPMSLAWCCEVVGLTPAKVRQTALARFPRKCVALGYRGRLVPCG